MFVPLVPFCGYSTALSRLKAKRPDTPRHLLLKDLPKEEQFSRLRAERKQFSDTLKLSAYRAGDAGTDR